MNRLTQTFTTARKENRKLLCPFLTAGYPSLEATTQLLIAIDNVNKQTNAIGAIELGIPFSDPIADGPTIQASYTHALSAGTTVAGTLAAVKQARAAGVTIPILAMVSFSIIFKIGSTEFAHSAAAAGIDGVVLPDVPLEEAPAVVAAMQSAGLLSSLLIAPTTPPARREKIAALCSAFVYYLSVTGITGERKDLPPDIAPNVAALRKLTPAPICVGFGISTPAHVKQVLQFADGAIVGSALIRQITNQISSPLPQLSTHIQTYIKHLTTGTL